MKKPNRLDLHLYGGVLLAAGSASWIYWPAGVIVLGLGLVYIGQLAVGTKR